MVRFACTNSAGAGAVIVPHGRFMHVFFFFLSFDFHGEFSWNRFTPEENDVFARKAMPEWRSDFGRVRSSVVLEMVLAALRPPPPTPHYLHPHLLLPEITVINYQPH